MANNDNWVGSPVVDFITGDDQWVFGASLGSVAPQLGPGDGESVSWVGQTGAGVVNTAILFNAGAPAYTIGNGGDAARAVGLWTVTTGSANVVNNSSNTQTFNVLVRQRISTIIAATGDIVFNGEFRVGDATSNIAHSAAFQGDDNIFLNGTVTGYMGGTTVAQQNDRSRIFYDGASTTAENAGKLILGDIGNTYRGKIIVRSQKGGAVVATHNNSFGDPTYFSGIRDTFIGNPSGGTGTLSNGVVEFDGTAGNLIIPEGFRLETRLSTGAPHIRNVAGNNSISNSATDAGYAGILANGGGSADAMIFESVSGKLTFEGGGIFNNVAMTANAYFQGNGDFEFVTSAAGLSGVTEGVAGAKINVIKRGSGTLTMQPGADMNYAGTTTIEGGTYILKSVHSKADAGAYTVNTGATLALSGSGAITSAPSITVDSGAFLDVSGLDGGGVMTLAPISPQTLNGSGTVTGGITAGAGASIVPGSSIGNLNITGALNLTGGASLPYELTITPATSPGTNDFITVGGDLTLSGVTEVPLTLTNGSLGNGTYTLLTYGGTLTGDLSNFNITGLPASSRQTFTPSLGGGKLNLGVVGFVGNLTWVGGLNSDAWDVGTTVNWTGETDSRFYDGDNVTFGSTGAQTVNVSGTVSPGNINFTNNAGQNYTINGGTAITASNVNVTGSGNVTVASGDFTVSSTMTMSGTGTLKFDNSNALLSLPTSIALNSGTLAVNHTEDLTIASALGGSGTFRKDNTNTLTATGNSSGFNGNILVTGGTLKVGNANALGGATAVTTVASGAALDLGGFSVANGNVKIAGTGNGTIIGALVNSGASAAIVSNVEMTADATLGGVTTGTFYSIGTGAAGTFKGNGFDLTVDTPQEIDIKIPGDMGIKNLIIGYTGGGTANALYIAGTTTLGPTNTGGKITLKDNGRLGFYGRSTGAANNGDSEATGAVTKPIVVDATANSSEIEVYNGNMTIDSPIQLDGNLSMEIYARTNGTWSTEFSAPITGTGNVAIHTASNGTSRFGRIVLTNDGNTYSGTTTIGGGGGFTGVSLANDRISQVEIGNGGPTGSIGTGDIIMNPANNTTALSLVLSKVGTLNMANNIIMNGNASVARVRGFSASNITLSGIISGAGRVTVEDPATTMTLTGDNTYTGITTALAGKMFVNGNHTGGNTYTVSAGATLGGSGTIGSLVNVSGTLAPGASIGTFTTTDSVTMLSGSSLAIEIAGATNDKLVVGGNLDLSATSLAKLLDVYRTGSGTSWVIATYSGALTGVFEKVSLGYTVDYGTGANSEITLTATSAAGDYNNDGKVDAADYVLWRKDDGSPGGYFTWRSAFGNPPGSGSSLDGGNVPEPAGIALMAMAAAIGGVRRRQLRGTHCY
jgi:autotransporter-associated beta strand protein